MRNSNAQRYYVYVHIDKATGKPFYVGKGTGRRAESERGRNPLWQEKIRTLEQEHDVRIVDEDLTEEEALKLEQQLIAEYGTIAAGTGSLVNEPSAPVFWEEWNEEAATDWQKASEEARSTFTSRLEELSAQLSSEFDQLVTDPETLLEIQVEGDIYAIRQAVNRVGLGGFPFCQLPEEVECAIFATEEWLKDTTDDEREEVRRFAEKMTRLLREELSWLEDSLTAD